MNQSATVNGVRHSLSWYNHSRRNFQMTCSCGWLGSLHRFPGVTMIGTFTTARQGAVAEANGHIRQAVRAGR